MFRLLLLVVLVCGQASAAPAPTTPLAMSVYATAGDVQRYLATPEGRDRAQAALRPLGITRVWLEGRRGDEYVPGARLVEVRDDLRGRGLQAGGGIATVPGNAFGTRQNGGLGWLNWESPKTQRGVAAFFTENAPIFDDLIVDDFYCTSDTSPESEQARGDRSWSVYRRDLLVSLLDPVIVQPARQARPGVRLILKYPQWYDRFHLFGYDPPRMSAPFDQIWVGTEVRDPGTRRMGFVQPTEGYVNFRWLASVAGDKVRGAWFDHIECSAQHFVDQAFQSVLAGAQELTLFHLGDLLEGHPGDAALAARRADLVDLAARVRGRSRAGVACYKPPGSEGDDNLYLMDYLAMIGWPILPTAHYPETARVAVFGRQAAADPDLMSKLDRHLDQGATLVLTPALVRTLGRAASDLAGVEVTTSAEAASAAMVEVGSEAVPLAVPLVIDGGVRATRSVVRIRARAGARDVPMLTEYRAGQGRVLVLNVRTFSEQDFRETGEWLLAPKALGFAAMPEALANALRATVLSSLKVEFRGRAGVALYLFSDARCVYNFGADAARLHLNGAALEVPGHGWLWCESP